MQFVADRSAWAEAALNIDWLILDVDGVLTDGSITYTSAGDEVKRFHVRDGSGLNIWRKLGKRAAIISGRSSAAVSQRAMELGIEPVYQGCDDKRATIEKLRLDFGLKKEQLCGVGDDLPDGPMLEQCGLAVAVADACPELKDQAHWVTEVPGGHGAVREVVEHLLKFQGRWNAVLDHFRSPA